MASSPNSPLPTTDFSSFRATPSSTYEYSSGFSQKSFLSDDFNVTSFINKCAANITQVINNDFKQTLNLIDGNDINLIDDNKNNPDDVFPYQHLTASNLKQLHTHLNECHENIKQELINLFETNYPQFLQLNESLRSGTELNLQKCTNSLNNIHKKYNNIYQQIFRLLERIHTKSKLKSCYLSKINKLKQIQFVSNILSNISQSISRINNDFNPFKDMNIPFKETDMNLLIDSISLSNEREQYRLLQKSSRLERIAILLCKLTAIFNENELNKHLLIVNKQNEFLKLRTKFYIELKNVFLISIKTKSLLSLRSNLRCYNYLNIIKPEQIVSDIFIKTAIYKCLPITIFEMVL